MSGRSNPCTQVLGPNLKIWLEVPWELPSSDSPNSSHSKGLTPGVPNSPTPAVPKLFWHAMSGPSKSLLLAVLLPKPLPSKSQLTANPFCFEDLRKTSCLRAHPDPAHNPLSPCSSSIHSPTGYRGSLLPSQGLLTALYPKLFPKHV